MNNKKGFTLIELLAVIIILGLIMLIAIPSVTHYISDSRKKTYINTAKELIAGARIIVNEGELETYSLDTTYYLDGECIPIESIYKSPYADFDKAYVVITYEKSGFNYYWTSVDEAGQGIKDIISDKNLDVKNIESGLKSDDISVERGIDGRQHIVLINKTNGCKTGEASDAVISINSETGKDVLELPEGKTRKQLKTGDLVKIKDQEFYVVQNDTTNDKITMISHYNLNVGNKKNNNAPEGIQSPSIKGKFRNSETYGTVPFSSTDYWTDTYGTGYATSSYYYMYDSNCNLYQYLEQYKEYLESLHVIVKEVKLPEDSNIVIINASKIHLTDTSFWFGVGTNISRGKVLTYIDNSGLNLISYNNSSTLGVRPVIVI